MICGKCGKNNPDGAAFCRFCGNRLQNAGDPNTPNMIHAQPQAPGHVPPHASGYVQPQASEYVRPQAPGYTQPQAPGYGPAGAYGTGPRTGGGYTDPYGRA